MILIFIIYSSALSRARSTKPRVQQYSTAMEAIQANCEPLDLDDDEIPYVKTETTNKLTY